MTEIARPRKYPLNRSLTHRVSRRFSAQRSPGPRNTQPFVSLSPTVVHRQQRRASRTFPEVFCCCSNAKERRFFHVHLWVNERIQRTKHISDWIRPLSFGWDHCRTTTTLKFLVNCVCLVVAFLSPLAEACCCRVVPLYCDRFNSSAQQICCKSDIANRKRSPKTNPFCGGAICLYR